jgi:large subunit ribosomal protein L1
MDALKKDMAQMSDRISKEIHEVVLSSTNSPGFTLSGDFRGADSVAPKELSGPL